MTGRFLVFDTVVSSMDSDATKSELLSITRVQTRIDDSCASEVLVSYTNSYRSYSYFWVWVVAFLSCAMTTVSSNISYELEVDWLHWGE